MEDTGCEVICGAHMTLAVKALVKVKGGQHQGKDRPGVRQVPEGSGEQRKMEETGCEVIKSSVVPQRPIQLRDR